MSRNPWLKLAAVSFAGIMISFVILWGASQFTGSLNNNNNQSYMNQYGMQNSMNYNGNGMSMQGNVNMQGNMNTQSSSSSGMGMMMEDDKNMMGNMNSSQGSMGMGMGM